MSGKTYTITLTGRPPVKLNDDKWPVIASASRHDGQVECQANRRWNLFVRQCKKDGDDRCLVYGVYVTAWQGESDRRGGEIVDSIDDVPDAVYEVAEYLGFDRRLADECIADLPAEEI